MIPLFLLWILAGWTAMPPPPPLPKYEIDPKLPPRPRPRPHWLILRIIGMVAGVIGGAAFVQVFGPHPEPWRAAGPSPEPWATAVFAAATTVGAFIAARFVTDIYEQLSNSGR